MRINHLVNITLQELVQRIHGSFCVRANGAERNGGTGKNAQRHNTKQTLGIHLPVVGLQPNAAFKLVCFLHKICSLTIVQPGLTANNNFLFEHSKHSFSSHPNRM